MSRATCPECGHTFRVATTDQELRFEEDVDWAMAVQALRSKRNPIVEAIRRARPTTVNVTIRPVVNAVSTIRIPPATADPDRPR